MCYNELLHYKPIMEECIITPCREKRLGVRVYFLTISAMTPSRSIIILLLILRVLTVYCFRICYEKIILFLFVLGSALQVFCF